MKPLPGVRLFFRAAINTLSPDEPAIHCRIKNVPGAFILKLRFCIFFLLCSGAFSPGLCQQVNFIKYTVQDGLVANPVRCMYQDKKGFIWVGTFDGLSRYDGYKFTNYTTINGLSHNFINSIIEVDGKLLITENNGSIYVFDNNSILPGYKVGSAAIIMRPVKDQILITTDVHGIL